MEVMKWLTVFGLGVVELWLAIPAGLALQLNPIAVAITAGSGAILGAVAVVLLSERVRNWLVRRHQSKNKEQQHGSINRIWHLFGIIGLGLLAPLLTGALLGAVLGLTLGVPAKRLLLWISLGVALWSAVLTSGAATLLLGVEINIIFLVAYSSLTRFTKSVRLA
ncbi:MAG: small multi-drug export protein [Anaerolinea sp.]|nr:small multi-drug export protein [Anaerolinea sp.]